jgi:putative ABC transport system ATP-binding protein
VIDIVDLVRIYRMGDIEVRALDGVSLSVEAGEFVAIMGPSGSGKTTLMNLLGCLDRPTSGVYRLDGIDVSRLDADALAEVRNAKIGFVFQSFNLLPRTSAAENVELPLLYGALGLGAEKRERLAREALRRVGLESRLHHYPSQLSGGQQQRVAIARALITDAPVLLADEPTGNLDSATSEDVLALFQELNDAGRTILLITHESDVADHARRIVALRDGRIVRDERIRQRRASPSSGAQAPAAAS